MFGNRREGGGDAVVAHLHRDRTELEAARVEAEVARLDGEEAEPEVGGEGEDEGGGLYMGAEAAASGEVKQEPGAEVKLEASVEVKQEASAAPAAPTAPAGGAGGVPPVVATPRELARAEAALRAKLVALGLVRGSEVALQEDPVV